MLSFAVLGVPQPQGSTRAFVPKGWTRAIITSANKNNKPWRHEVASCALNEMKRMRFTMCGKDVAVRVEVAFYFDRPKSVRKSQLDKVTKPDVDKLARSVLDALTGIAFVDDSQVTDLHVMKAFGSPARAQIEVAEVDFPPSKTLAPSVDFADIPF